MSKSKIKVIWYGEVPAQYRDGTSDFDALREVVGKSIYRKRSVGFDVEPGETWLDLGANIGSFAIYCIIRGATAECYEPNAECFKLLLKNASGCECHQMAVTHRQEPSIQFFKSKDEENHYRGTWLQVRGMLPAGSVKNLYAGEFADKEFDGIKLDIEGSEFGLIDEGLIPKCRKLVMEYHTSRDSSAKNLTSRLEILRSQFDHVIYPPEYDRMIAKGGPVKCHCDRFIHCWND